MNSSRRDFLKTALYSAPFISALPGIVSCASAPKTQRKQPNFVILFTDDQGYNDVGCFGSENIRTPRIDKMAKQGTKLTSFYAQPVCGPSRTALLTGSYPMRTDSILGWSLATEEVTVAEVLKKAGYSTGLVGKWDLSQRKYIADRHPMSQGFDYFYGTLGANDKGRMMMMNGREEIGVEDDMGKVTGTYTEKAVDFLESHAEGPFLLYLAYTMPHTKLGASEKFKGKSKRGLYGDVIEEIDHSVGRVLDTIQQLGIDRDTVVLFTSDNGPWLVKKERGGSAFPLKAGKGSAYEGGFRVPCVLWGPGRIPARRTSNAMMSTLDVMPTFAELAGAEVPRDRVIDGQSEAAFITGKQNNTNRNEFYYYLHQHLQAVRRGKWKLLLPREKKVFGFAPTGYPISSPQLYDLDKDISEQHDVSGEHPETVRQLLLLAEKVKKEICDGEVVGTHSRATNIQRKLLKRR
ncbi:sulfatase [Candidatus Hydrogenedentota bacterium]